MERERALGRAGAALLAALTRDELDAVAVSAARELAGSGAVALLRADGDRGARGARRRRAGAAPPSGQRVRAGRHRPGAGRPRGPRRARRPRDPGRDGLRAHGADRGARAPSDRGALRLPGAALLRPDHGAGARRDRRLPEPGDRARARLDAGGGRGAPDRPPHGARGGRPAAASGRRRGRRPGHRCAGAGVRRWRTRTAAHASSRCCSPTCSTTSTSGGIVLNAPRRLRAQGLRAPARPPGLPRPGHRAAQPRAVRRARAPRDRAQPARAPQPSASCSSTSTTSRPSTTRSATPRATRC